MNTRFRPLALTFCLILSGTQISALPVHYLFEGKVSGISGPDPAGLGIDDPVWYLFSLDTELPGMDVHHSQLHAFADDADVDYFFSEYLDGSSPLTESLIDGDSFYFGSQSLGEGSAAVRLRGSDDHTPGLQYNSKVWGRISIDSDAPLSAWAPGLSGFRGENTFWSRPPGSGPAGVSIYSDLTLTAISYPSVPEPASLALFAIGAGAALMAYARGRAAARFRPLPPRPR